MSLDDLGLDDLGLDDLRLDWGIVGPLGGKQME
jgi:hypothetical protein